MEVAFLIGRIILGGFFIMSGLNHFFKFGMMKGYAAMKGAPLPGASVAGTGAVLALGGMSLLLGIYPTVGVILLVAFLLAAAFIMHNFWTVQDPQARMADQVNFMKNLALAGALLMILSIPQPWAFSLMGR
jgi:putative oxidoreductase